MKSSENIDQLSAALALAQGEFKEASKEGKSHHGKHLTLTSVWEAAREPLSKNGLCIFQSPSFQDGRVNIITRLSHKSGQWVETELSIKPTQDNAQQIGSAITYGRRYSLAPLIGIVQDEDDDGNGAVGKDKDGKKLPDADPNQATFTQKIKQPDSAPLVMFNRHDQTDVSKVEARFIERKLSLDCYDSVFEDLHGKPFTRKAVELAIDKMMAS